MVVYVKARVRVRVRAADSSMAFPGSEALNVMMSPSADRIIGHMNLQVWAAHVCVPMGTHTHTDAHAPLLGELAAALPMTLTPRMLTGKRKACVDSKPLRP